MSTAEHDRLADSDDSRAAWRHWGPYVSARQWGTVREDYSADGNAWEHLPFDHAHLRAYRWGEDGLAGLCDVDGFLNLGLALWNGRDDRLKERLFGLTNPQGNHGEDVKEYWWALEGTPTHSYASWLYRYPQAAFPYEELVRVNGERARRGRRGVRARRHPGARRGPLLRRPGHARQGQPERHLRRDHRHQPRAGSRCAAPGPAAVVPQHVELGARRTSSAAVGGRPARGV
ncbi:hypothetical protein [Serinicoccus marinus]|uniref:hypothetical protein n=1 Tax=Serinicoccus marinus TaxID=247333 RepID=UPI003B8A62A1